MAVSFKKLYDKKQFEKFNQLSNKKKNFVWLYITPDYEEPQLHKKTFNDAFSSYIASHKIKVDGDPTKENSEGFLKVIKYTYNAKFNKYEITEGETFDKVEYKVYNSELYKKHLRKAAQLEKECQAAITEIRLYDYKEHQQDKQLELMQNIHVDAIHHPNLRYKTDNRKMAMDMYNMKNNEPQTNINIYEKMGKRVIKSLQQSNDTLSDITVDEDELEKYEEEDK